MDARITARETELQTLLADERSRCDQHKQMYKTLKEKHNGLQEELIVIYEQLKQTREQYNQYKTSKESYIKKLEDTLSQKQDEIRVLKEKVSQLSSGEEKEKAIAEVSKRFEERIRSLQNEVDATRQQYSELHYEHTVMRCQTEYLEAEHSREKDLIKAKHLSEIGELQTKIDILESEKKAPVEDYSEELRAAEKECMQVNSRLKTLLAECEELRAENERLTVQMDSITRAHSKQLVENTAAIRNIESEKSSILMQKEVLQTQVANLENQKQDLSNHLQDMKQQLLQLRSQLEDCKNKYEIDTSNLKIEIQQFRVESETEKERLQGTINRLYDEANQLRMDVERRKQIDSEKEQAYQKQVLITKQESWQKCAELEQEKEQMELKLKELEIKGRENSRSMQAKFEEIEQNLKAEMNLKAALQKEVDRLRSHLEVHTNDKKDFKLLEALQKQNLDFMKEVQQLREQIKQLITGTVDLSAGSKKETHSDIDNYKSSTHEEIVQLRLTLEQQKYQYQQRIDVLENQLKEQKNTWLNEKRDMEIKLRQYARLITKLRDRLEGQKNHLEELEVQNEILSKNVPLEDHLELKRKLAAIQRKQEEFREVMNVALPFSPDIYSQYFTPAGGGEQVRQVSAADLLHHTLAGDMKQFSGSGTKPLYEIHDINVSESVKAKSPKSSHSRQLQRPKFKSKRAADYSSSSDIENL